MSSAGPRVSHRIIITIDGPAGSGKSTVAHRLAERLGLEVLDTGAMYRAAALLAIERGIDPEDGPTLAEAVREAGLAFDWTADPPRLLMEGRDVSRRIRDMDVSSIVSIVAALPEVRAVLVGEQRRLGDEHPRLVTEGRDQGSVVFPDAPLRFFLDADAAVRARRRIAQLAESGTHVEEALIINDIRERDRIDSTRADGPLKRPEGAIEINTSDLSIEEVVDRLESIAREELAKAEFKA
jgi:cytidylate kinase